MSNFERQTYIKKQSIDTEFNANYHSKNRKNIQEQKRQYFIYNILMSTLFGKFD